MLLLAERQRTLLDSLLDSLLLYCFESAMEECRHDNMENNSPWTDAETICLLALWGRLIQGIAGRNLS